MHFTIYGNPTTKKNHLRMARNRRTGRLFPIQSKSYADYEENALEQLFTALQRMQSVQGYITPIDYPVTVKCLYYMQTRRRVDLTNLLEATDDILQKCWILADDCRDVIASHDGSRVYYDKDNPRVEIEIQPFTEDGWERWKK